jgi:hypothetical protein
VPTQKPPPVKYTGTSARASKRRPMASVSQTLNPRPAVKAKRTWSSPLYVVPSWKRTVLGWMMTIPAVTAPKGSIRPPGRLTVPPIWIQ